MVSLRPREAGVRSRGSGRLRQPSHRRGVEPAGVARTPGSLNSGHERALGLSDADRRSPSGSVGCARRSGGASAALRAAPPRSSAGALPAIAQAESARDASLTIRSGEGSLLSRRRLMRAVSIDGERAAKAAWLRRNGRSERPWNYRTQFGRKRPLPPPTGRWQRPLDSLEVD